MTSPTALVRLRLPALLTVLATVVLLLGAGARGHAAPVSRALSPAAPTPSPSAPAGGFSRTAGSSLAMLVPAPTRADLSDATLEVPESCALRTSPSDATRGATGTVTFSGGQAASPPGAREYLPSATTTIRDAYMPKGATVEECGLLPSLTEPDSQGTSHMFLNDDHDATIRPGGSQVITGAYYQAGDVMRVMSGAKGGWLMLHGKEDGGVEVYTPGPAGD